MVRVYFSDTYEQGEKRILEKLKVLPNGGEIKLQEFAREVELTPSIVKKYLDKIEEYQDLPYLVVNTNTYIKKKVRR
tara:strand:+ start:1608 stop:1838 length:231 start_codon:yes stop_codon:yes gene_type:complete